MNNLKCSECNFTNFAADTVCKKCAAPLSKRRARPQAELPENAHACLSCGNLVVPETKFKASVFVEGVIVLAGLFVAIWINFFLGVSLFLIGAAMALFRGNGRLKLCPACGNKNIVPADTPAAKQLIASLQK